MEEDEAMMSLSDDEQEAVRRRARQLLIQSNRYSQHLQTAAASSRLGQGIPGVIAQEMNTRAHVTQNWAVDHLNGLRQENSHSPGHLPDSPAHEQPNEVPGHASLSRRARSRPENAQQEGPGPSKVPRSRSSGTDVRTANARAQRFCPLKVTIFCRIVLNLTAKVGHLTKQTSKLEEWIKTDSILHNYDIHTLDQKIASMVKARRNENLVEQIHNLFGDLHPGTRNAFEIMFRSDGFRFVFLKTDGVLTFIYSGNLKNCPELNVQIDSVSRLRDRMESGSSGLVFEPGEEYQLSALLHAPTPLQICDVLEKIPEGWPSPEKGGNSFEIFSIPLRDRTLAMTTFQDFLERSGLNSLAS